MHDKRASLTAPITVVGTKPRGAADAHGIGYAAMRRTPTHSAARVAVDQGWPGRLRAVRREPSMRHKR